MPELNQVTCSIELGRTNRKLREYGTTYGNKQVQCYIAVPNEEVNFSIRLTSKGYIAPGLAMFVFVDGQYQCNRNRAGLRLPDGGTSPRDYEVDFRVRQKEEQQPNDKFIGRDWSFASLNTTGNDTASREFIRNVGTIEVIVLRLKATSRSRGPGSVTDVGEESDVKANKTNKNSNKKAEHVPPAENASTRSQLGYDGSADDDAGISGFPNSAATGLPEYPARFISLFSDASVSSRAAHEEQFEDYEGVVHEQMDQATSRHSSPDHEAAASYLEDDRENSWLTGDKIGEYGLSIIGKKDAGQQNHLGLDGEDGWMDSGEKGSKKSDKGGGWPNDENKGGGWSNDENKGGGWSNDESKGGKWGDDDKSNKNGGWSNDENKGGGWSNDDKNNDKKGAWSNAENEDSGKPKKNDKAKKSKASDQGWGNNNKADANAWDNKGVETVEAKVTYRADRNAGFRAPHRSSAASDAGSAAFEQPKTKDYWKDWKKGTKGYSDSSDRTVAASVAEESIQFTLRDPYIFPAYDLPAILSDDAKRRNVQAQVKTSKGAWYWHATGTPDYLDEMASPYAVFTFKYRSKRALEKMFTKDIEESAEVYEQKIKTMTPEEMREEMMRLNRAKHKPVKEKRLQTLPRAEMSVKEKVVDNWDDGTGKPAKNDAFRAASKAASKASNERGAKHSCKTEYTYEDVTEKEDEKPEAVQW